LNDWLTDEVKRQLRDSLGTGRLLLDPDLTAAYGADATGRFGSAPAAVAQPGNLAQVASLLSACTRIGAPVVPQGGNTGLVGGGVPRSGELVVSLAKLKELGEIDFATGQVVAGAGTTLEELQRHVLKAGFEAPIDFGARSAATIGGMAATNAGGALAMRYGTMRSQVVGVEAVLADGAIIDRLSGPLKDNAGYDLPAMLIGTEGTLCIFTRVAVRLVPAMPKRIVALFGSTGLADGLELLAALRRAAPSLVALDFFDAWGLERVRAHRNLPNPFQMTHNYYFIAEFRADVDPIDELVAAVEAASLDVAVVVADDSAGRDALWAYRELQNESIAAAGVPHKMDVSVAPGAIPTFAAEVRREIALLAPDAETILYGHLGDGNVHVNVLGPPPDDERVDLAVLKLVSSFGGSISAEHGVGVAKPDYLHLSRSENEIAAMSRLKIALDPAWILNPGCVLPIATGANLGPLSCG
jgi:FAD/FMN-containing dehydrogenase